MIRDLARKAVETDYFEGNDAKRLFEILTGDQKWKLGVALALEYLNLGKKDQAEDILEALLNEDPDAI